MKNDLTRDEIELYLQEINEKLREQNKHGEILLAGGASLTLVYNARNATKDIDAFFRPADEIKRIAQNMAEKYSLSDDWLNDGVKGFMQPTMKTETVKEYSNLTVSSLDAESLLAMKLSSARADTKDMQDAVTLMKHLKIENEGQLIGIVEKHVPRDKQLPKVFYFLQNALEEYQNQEKFINHDIEKLCLEPSPATENTVRVKVISETLEEKINENNDKIKQDKETGHNTKDLAVNVQDMKNFKAMVDKVNDRNYPIKINGAATAENIISQKTSIGKQISNIRVKEKGNTQALERER